MQVENVFITLTDDHDDEENIFEHLDTVHFRLQLNIIFM